MMMMMLLLLVVVIPSMIIAIHITTKSRSTATDVSSTQFEVKKASSRKWQTYQSPANRVRTFDRRIPNSLSRGIPDIASRRIPPLPSLPPPPPPPRISLLFARFLCPDWRMARREKLLRYRLRASFEKKNSCRARLFECSYFSLFFSFFFYPTYVRTVSRMNTEKIFDNGESRYSDHLQGEIYKVSRNFGSLGTCTSAGSLVLLHSTRWWLRAN